MRGVLLGAARIFTSKVKTGYFPWAGHSLQIDKTRDFNEKL